MSAFRLNDAINSGSVERTISVLSDRSIDINQVSGEERWTPLLLATEKGYLRIVRVLLRHGAGVSLANRGGETPLHMSMFHKHRAVSKALVNAGADLGARDEYNFQPIHVAAETGFHAGISVLVGGGASVDSRLEGGESPLFLAAENGWLESVKCLLRAKANPMVATEGELDFPLDVAARNGHLEVVRELANRVGIERCTSDGGEFALIEAADNKHADVVAFLCDEGVVDTDCSALACAIGGKSEECVKILLERRGGHGHISACEYMNIPQSLELLGSPLVLSFELGGFYSPRIARLLIEAGADTTSAVLVQDNDGGITSTSTPAHLAEMYMRKWETESHDTTADGGAGILNGLRLVTRLLRQISAVHSSSWLWPRDSGGAAREKSEKKSTPTIVRMLPRGRRGTTINTMAALSRYTDKMDGMFLGYDST